MIRIAIVDDERTILDHLREKVSNTANELSIDHTIETFLNGADLLQRNKEVSFHIIFLDLEMPDPDGLSTAQQLREASPDVALIFITNRSDLVFRAFAYDVIGFVRKSHIEEELRPTLDRAYQKVLMRMANYIFRTEQGERIFPSDSICYFVSHKHKVFLCNETKEMTRVMTTLEKLEDFLSPRCFVRCHSGIIVNCRSIHSIGTASILLTNGDQVPLSRNRIKTVKQVFQRYLRSI